MNYENLSQKTVLKTGINVNSCGHSKEVKFIHRSAGLGINGYNVSEAWGCIFFHKDNTTGGQWFADEQKAIEIWDRLTNSEVTQ